MILLIGVHLILGKKEQTSKAETYGSGIKMFLSSFIVGVTNPAAIFTFLFAFSYFGINETTEIFDGIQLVGGVFIGTCIWWCLLSTVVVCLKKKTENHSFRHMNQVFGIVLAMFGVTIFIRTFL